ncbi:SGNH/GDSL hydrolase family protein [soil metagenome]
MRRLSSAMVVVAVLGSACTRSPAAESPDAEPPTAESSALESPADGGVGGIGEARPRYVALGDSFTAGPLVPTTDLANGCLRSDGNYPALLADGHDLDLTDVSCSGATTQDLLRRQRTVQDASVPPQLMALDRRTDLVTLGIGGNDQGLFSTLVQTCLKPREQVPAGSPCTDSETAGKMLGGLDTVGDDVELALSRIQRRAPRARVVLVGYLRVVPSSGTCADRLPFTDRDVRFGDRLIRALAAELEDAARAAEVDYLDMYAASRGHDVCSTDPWVQGAESTPGVAAAFHPLAAGMQAVTAELEDLLADWPRSGS